MNKPLKIAIYSGEIPSTTFIERLITAVAKKDTEVYLFGAFSKRTVYPKAIKMRGYRQQRAFKLLYLLRYHLLLTFFKASELKRFNKFLKSEGRDDLYSKVKYYPVLWYQPDIFHLQWAKGIAEWAWVEDFGMQLILSLRGAHINYSPIADAELAARYKTYFPKVSGFHAVSKAIALEAQRYGAKNKAINLVYSGLPETGNLNTPLNKKNNTPWQIISVGRPHWKKGYSYALDACRILKNEGVAFEYRIIGGAGDIELLYQIKDLDLQDEVALMGPQPYETVQDLMAKSDVLLLPSVEEGIANVVLEAMALGTLVLTTNCGGMEETVVDGVNGFVVPIREPEAMARKIMGIIKLNDLEKNEIIDRALKTIQEQHTEELMVEGMMHLYEQVLK